MPRCGSELKPLSDDIRQRERRSRNSNTTRASLYSLLRGRAKGGKPHVSSTEIKKKGRSTEAKPQTKRVVFTMGGKGGTGKTGCMLAIAEWFEANQIPFTLLDLDTENKARGSLKHYFNVAARKVNIHTPAGLDTFIDHLAAGAPVILADMGAGSGQVAHGWFDSMYEDVAEQGIAFTAIGIVTSDPASVESVLSWANRLQSRVDYLIVENAAVPHADMTYWRE